MRNDYERIDSYGYEYMEGIVAGVEKLAEFDVELDSGVPTKGAQPTDQIANISLQAGDLKIPTEMKAVEVNITVRSPAGEKQAPRTVRPEIPPEVEAIVVKAMHPRAVCHVCSSINGGPGTR